MDEIKVGMVGLGYWGKNILRNLYELGAVTWACDTNPDTLKQREKEYPAIKYTLNFKEILNNPEIKAVVIATPAAGHYSLVKKALTLGKDVFVEKPLALTAKEGSELTALARKLKLVLMVGHILQYHPAVVKLKSMISGGELGKIRYLYSNRLNIGKLRTEENILWSFAPHDISAILMLLDEEPVSVSAFGADYLTAGISDVTLTALEFKDGVKAHVFVSWLHPYKEQKLIVVGSKAMAVFDDVSNEKLFLYPHTIEWKDGKIPVAQKADFKIVPVEAGEPLRLELEHFIECVRERKNPKTDGVEAMKVLKVLESAEESVLRNNSKSGANKYFLHQTACVDEDVEIGEGTQIWHFSHILKGSRIGKNCKIGQNVAIGPNTKIGNGCKIQNNVSIYEGVTLEDEVFCGPSCVFTNVMNPRSAIPRMKEIKATLVKKGATIGANATIVCGYTLGKSCFVGAGAVATKDVPDYALVYGNPAKIQDWMCECGVKLEFKKSKAKCRPCGKEYKLSKGTVICLK